MTTRRIDEWANSLRSFGAKQTPGQQSADDWLRNNPFDEEYWNRVESHPDYNPEVNPRALETVPYQTGFQGFDEFRQSPHDYDENSEGGHQPESSQTESSGEYTHHFEVAPMYRSDEPLHISIGHSGWEDRDGLGHRPVYRYQVSRNGRPVHRGEDLWGPVGHRPSEHEMARTLADFMSYDGDSINSDPNLEDEENSHLRNYSQEYRDLLSGYDERLSMAGMEPDPNHPEYEPLRRVDRIDHG